MQEIKYTTDGKKVVIIGKLNSQETIVQEIFVTANNAEIPSGENFVVKSLHDAPVISYKEKTLKELEERFCKEEKRWKDEISALDKRQRNVYKDMEERLKYISKAVKNLDADSFKMISDFLTAKIEFVVVSETWSPPKLLTFSEFTKPDNDMERELRLISIFGRDDGTLKYAQGAYSDSSGSKTNFLPFTNYEDAFIKFKELLLSRNITNEIIEIAKKYYIELDENKVAIFIESVRKSLADDIVKKQSEIEKIQEKINQLNIPQ